MTTQDFKPDWRACIHLQVVLMEQQRLRL